jgi:hypothetical protein
MRNTRALSRHLILLDENVAPHSDLLCIRAKLIPPYRGSMMPSLLSRWLRRMTVIGLLGAASLHMYAAGASVPFTTLEAEAGNLAGGASIHAFKLGSSVPNAATLELEASGGAFVQLNRTGSSVSWRNPVANANTIVVRSSLPDTPKGGGITATIDLYVDGKFRQAIELSSKQSWVYRSASGWVDDPKSGGMPFKFYNEDRSIITGDPIPEGSTITLRKDETNKASEYNLDCIDVEHVSEPSAQPPNSLSVLDCGADPKGEIDSQGAIQKCVNDARTKGQSVWIPAGRYLISSVISTGLELTNVTVQGAGMWYTTLYRQVPDTFPESAKQWRSYVRVKGKTHLSDLSIDSNSTVRSLGHPHGGDYGILASGDGWLIQRVWIAHCDAQWLSGSNGTIRDSRVADSWGDGINLNNGNKPNPDSVGINLTAENNFVRGTGDDGLATYSDRGAGGNNTQMTGTKLLNNTSVAPYWANSLRVAGGKDVVVRNNLLTDPSSNNGMDVSVYGKSGQPLESALIEGNVILRGGGWNGNNRYGLAIGSPPAEATSVIVRNNVIRDSRRAGIYIGPTLERVILENNQIIHPATTGILVDPRVAGTGIFTGNVITGLNSSQKAIVNQSPKTFAIEMPKE